jgi:ribosomal protein S18 acetylase RimI-like enzyme
VDWPALRARNVPLLLKLTDVYGACAVVAREGERIVGTLRFYPRAVWTLARSEGFCLQQPFPSGPPQDLAGRAFCPLDALEDRTLAVHCLAVGQPGARGDPRRRKGLGSRMVRTLIDWARPRGWRAIEATTHVDLDLLYDISGTAGRHFWERLGFQVVRTDVEAVLQEESELLEALRREAAERGIPTDRLADRYTLRLELA